MTMRYSVLTNGVVTNIIVLDPAHADTFAASSGLTVRPWQPGDTIPEGPAPEPEPNPAADALDNAAATAANSLVADVRDLAAILPSAAAALRGQ